MTEYSGWKNYQTQNIADWIQNDETIYNIISEGPITDYKLLVGELDNIGITHTPDGIAYNDKAIDTDELDELLRELTGQELSEERKPRFLAEELDDILRDLQNEPGPWEVFNIEIQAGDLVVIMGAAETTAAKMLIVQHITEITKCQVARGTGRDKEGGAALARELKNTALSNNSSVVFIASHGKASDIQGVKNAASLVMNITPGNSKGVYTVGIEKYRWGARPRSFDIMPNFDNGTIREVSEE